MNAEVETSKFVEGAKILIVYYINSLPHYIFSEDHNSPQACFSEN